MDLGHELLTFTNLVHVRQIVKKNHEDTYKDKVKCNSNCMNFTLS